MSKQLIIQTPNDTTVVITRSFDAPQRLVFAAYTKCEHLKKWMLGPADWVITDCNVWHAPGEEWSITWDKKEGGQPMTLHGVCREFVPTSRIVVTENWGDPWPEHVNTMEFIELDGVTDIIVTIEFVSKEARDAATATGMSEGMEVSYARLDALLREMG
jgi:uncharacterized protein YndB with AHSA1/START domain